MKDIVAKVVWNTIFWFVLTAPIVIANIVNPPLAWWSWN